MWIYGVVEGARVQLVWSDSVEGLGKIHAVEPGAVLATLLFESSP